MHGTAGACWQGMIRKFPDVHAELRTIASSSLEDAKAMDRAIPHKRLRGVFDEECDFGAGGVDLKLLSKNQLISVLTKLQCQLVEPMLSRAMDMMDPIHISRCDSFTPPPVRSLPPC